MKQNFAEQSRPGATIGKNIEIACFGFCRKLLAQVARVKETILNESTQKLQAHQHLLQLAVNEAEALARQTLYPHLIFPTLATEKVRAVLAWEARQQAIRGTHSAVLRV
ncbi:MAG: hypothetical protein ACTHLW_00445 [Verrucomicrobiota bacterium]